MVAKSIDPFVNIFAAVAPARAAAAACIEDLPVQLSSSF
jgi:hypothetical protein